MNKIGDIKKKIKFAFFPVKMTNRLKGNDFIWFKKYINVFEYKQMSRRRMLPVEGIATEDGKAVFDRRFSKYKTYTYEKWVRVDRYKIKYTKYKCSEGDTIIATEFEGNHEGKVYEIYDHNVPNKKWKKYKVIYWVKFKSFGKLGLGFNEFEIKKN